MLTLKGKMIITDNIGTTYPKADLFFEAYEEDSVRHDSTVTVTGLSTESQIGINLSDERYNNAYVLGTATQDVADCFFTSDLNRFRTYVNGSNQLIATNYVAEDGTTYQVMNDAVAAVQAAGETTFKAQAGNGIDRQDVVLTGDMTIDLNGRIISKIVTGEYTLSLTDSETNDFDVDDGNYGQVKVEGNLASDCKDGSNKYVVLTGEDGISTAHRVYVSITSRLLRPISRGAGFKAVYATDRMVTDAASAFGIEVTFQSKDTENREFLPVPFSGRMDAGLPEDENDNPNEKLLAVTNMAPDDWENTLYGRAYVAVGDATVYSTERNLVMKDMAAKALLDGSGISDVVKNQLTEMMTAYGLTTD